MVCVYGHLVKAKTRHQSGRARIRSSTREQAFLKHAEFAAIFGYPIVKPGIRCFPRRLVAELRLVGDQRRILSSMKQVTDDR